MDEPNLFARATDSAKTIVKFDWLIFAFGVVMAIEWWLSSLLPGLGGFAAIFRTIFILIDLIWFVPLWWIINWFISHGALETNDNEFQTARKSLIMSFLLWFAANALNLLLLNYKGWFSY